MCIGSAIYVSLAALNYLSLYPALSDIQQQMPFQVDNASLIQAAGVPTIAVYVTVSNPTSYSGLGLSHVSVMLYFFADANPNNTIFYNPIALNASQVVGVPLGPNSADTVKLVVQLTTEQATQLVSFNDTNQGQIMAAVMLRVDLSTFLEPVTGTIFYTRTQNVPLSS
jgi:hypothetical protein